ncbi:uncharacterized protein LOC126556700 [Anopheles maculipalpis]|uniref:uncharacterized protein LOC126556700 n=1 Tax=Anopheles maculipalpis TaxID=1496333 RepID=UPI002158F99F|nr:uncharacterized protein LOC126556700 [Anopheles maculipalpis]
MSISLCIMNPGGSPSTVAPMQSSQATSSTMDRDRQTIDGGEKGQNISKTYRKAMMPQYQSTAVPMMYGSNKRQKCFNNSSNRKKQQHLINNLKSWNLQIAPSGLDKPDVELSTVTAAACQKKEVVRPFASKCTAPAKPVQDSAAASVGEGIKLSSKKKVLEFKSNRCKFEEMKENTLIRLATLKIDRDIASNPKEQSKIKLTKSIDLPTEESVVEDNGQSHESPAHLSETVASSTTEASSGCAGEVSAKPIVSAIAVAESQSSTFTVRGSHQKHSHKSFARSSTTNTSTSAAPTSVPYTVCVETLADGSRNGIDCTNASGQTHVSVMSLMLQGNSKQNESLRLDYFSDNSSVASSSHTKTIHPNQLVGQHHGSYIPTLGAQVISRHDHHHSVSQNNNTSPNQYKFDFLRDVGLKMSLSNVTGGANNTSTGDVSMYRGSSQAHYNFTQQFQQQMMQHQQTNPLQQQNHGSSHQSPHHQPPHQLLQLHRLMPQQPPYGRSQNVYGGDELSAAQHCGLSDPQGFSSFTLLNTVEGHSSMHVGKDIELSSYLYNQNGGGVHSQHQAMHYKQQLLEQQQQHTVQMQNYHQNNNYQYHNRNGQGQTGHQLSYPSQGAARVIGTVTGREEGGRNGVNGKKFWNAHGKGRNNSYHTNNGSSKQASKMQSAGFGYRKNYQHYYNHPAGSGNHYYEHITIQQQQQQQQHQQQAQSHHHHKQQHLHRNLVYVRGYDRGHGAVSSHEYANGNQHQEVEHTEQLSHSAPSSPPAGNSAVEDTVNCSEAVEKNGDNQPTTENSKISSNAHDALSYDGYREEESCEEKVKSSELREERVYSSRKLCGVPRSSSSSSVVSIPSTESSVISCNTSQLESTLANGHDYESDSSHSSDYREGTFRYSKYNDTNVSQGTRSTSSASSGVSSSSTTYPPLKEFVPSAPSSLHASTAGLVGEFMVRSQSFHGSHQNLTTYGNGNGGGCGVDAGGVSPPVGSPKTIPRTVTGTQSAPVFGELFGNTNHCQTNSIHFIHSQSAGNFGSSSSLELALHSAATNSSSSSSLSASSVPPNDFQSMQSGHPKARSRSGRTSPTNTTNAHYRSNTSTQHNKGQLSNGGRKNIHAALSGAHRPALLGEFHQATPADRFIMRANDVEMKVPPDALTDGSVWDSLSKAIWERFAAAQQSEEKYIQKMELWRELYICIKKGFPKYNLYLVGSTISGFGADSSDVDMCLVSRSGPSCYDHRFEALFSLSLVKEYFMNMPSSSFSEFSLIQAKVPILRFQDSKNGIEVDLNFNNCVGIRNTHLLHCYAQMDWRVRPLVLMVKLWAQHHNINDAKNMTISSYSLVLMVIHFLQCGTTPPILPCLHAMYPEKFMKIVDIHNIEMIEHIEPYQTDNKESLGELLLNFLEYYTKFDYEHYAISVRTSSIIPIEECRLARSYKNDPHHWKHLCIEEPFDFTNTARSVFDGDVFEQIKSTFATSWRMLKDNKNLNVLFGEPLFTPVTSTLSITS